MKCSVLNDVTNPGWNLHVEILLKIGRNSFVQIATWRSTSCMFPSLVSHRNLLPVFVLSLQTPMWRSCKLPVPVGNKIDMRCISGSIWGEEKLIWQGECMISVQMTSDTDSWKNFRVSLQPMNYMYSYCVHKMWTNWRAGWLVRTVWEGGTWSLLVLYVLVNVTFALYTDDNLMVPLLAAHSLWRACLSVMEQVKQWVNKVLWLSPKGIWKSTLPSYALVGRTLCNTPVLFMAV